MRKVKLVVIVALLLAAVVVPGAMAADQPLTPGSPTPQSSLNNQDFYQQMFLFCHGNGGMMGSYWGTGNQNQNQGFQGTGYYGPQGMMYY